MSEDQKVKSFENVVDFILYARQRFQSEEISFYLSTAKPSYSVVWTVDIGNESVFVTRSKPEPPYLLFMTHTHARDAEENDPDPAHIWLREQVPRVSRYSVYYYVLRSEVEIHSNLSFLKKTELTIYSAASSLRKRNPERVNYAIARQQEDRVRNILKSHVPDGYCVLFKSAASNTHASVHVYNIKAEQIIELNSLIKSFFHSKASQREELEMLIKQLEQEIEQKKKQLEELREALRRLEEIDELKESLME